jgi:hypothetical protein
MWKDTKAFRVLFNYHGSDTVVEQRKQRDGTYNVVFKSHGRLLKVHGRRRYS